ncbi:hypothetical protein IW262DRAFT_1293382 [Armillaria fumosa]|nr:hypothetical protein IW262DRAFT_1293382 [Armillaria fumosa]
MSVHVERAKKWDTNPWLAEWLDNTVKHCKGSGKKVFEAWVLQIHGRVEGRKMLSHCSDPPVPLPAGRYSGKGLGNTKTWNKAAVEFESFGEGVSDRTLTLYHTYASTNDCCVPPRTKPAPKRRRLEPSSEWLADRTRDTAEIWRRDFEFFMRTNGTRRRSIIPSPQILGLGNAYIEMHTSGDAFINLNFHLHIFEDLARRGLCTPFSIERAYRKDDDLMWRLFACGMRAHNYMQMLWVKLRQVITYCEYYRPYFKRYRDQTGMSHIETNHQYWSTHPLQTELDCLIIQSMGSESNGSSAVGFHDGISRKLYASPSEATKFNTEAFEVLGDYAVVCEFHANMVMSPFGETLRQYAFQKSGDVITQGMLKYVIPMDPEKIDWVSTVGGNFKYHKQATDLNDYGSSHWSDVVHETGDLMMQAIQRMFNVPAWQADDGVHKIRALDQLWKEADEYFWNAAHSIDRSNEKGRVAREYGLLDPNGARPTFWETFVEMAQSIATAKGAGNPLVEMTPTSTQTPPKTSTPFPTSIPSNAQSERPDTEELGLDLKEFPDFLPPFFNLPKKMLKVFQRLLAVDPDALNTEPKENPKREHVRWGDFERVRVSYRLHFDDNP